MTYPLNGSVSPYVKWVALDGLRVLKGENMLIQTVLMSFFQILFLYEDKGFLLSCQELPSMGRIGPAIFLSAKIK